MDSSLGLALSAESPRASLSTVSYESEIARGDLPRRVFVSFQRGGLGSTYRREPSRALSRYPPKKPSVIPL
jgi:hypothetical protein